jgi:hypothetical protein
MVFKDTYHIERGSSGQYFVIDQKGQIVHVAYSQEMGKELLEYYNTTFQVKGKHHGNN